MWSRRCSVHRPIACMPGPRPWHAANGVRPTREHEETGMGRWGALLIVVLMLSCEKTPEVPVVPPPPEDLSTWAVPQLVQPPAPEAPPPPASVPEKSTPAEQVYTFAPGTTFAVR